MPLSPAGFLQKAQGLSKNPLGIIALFIGLIYGAVVIVAGFSTHLNESQRWLLSAFAVVFPIVVIAIFYRLVTRHHSKLYAPSDWRDERNLFGPQPPELKRLREEADLQTITLGDEIAGMDVPTGHPSDHHTQSRVALLHLLREAATLGFRYLEAKFRLPIARDIVLPGPLSNVPFDGLIIGAQGKVLGVDIKFLRSVKNVTNVVLQVLESGSIARPDAAPFLSFSRMPFAVLLLVVTHGLSKADRDFIAKKATELATRAEIPFSVEVHDLDDLRQSYG